MELSKYPASTNSCLRIVRVSRIILLMALCWLFQGPESLAFRAVESVYSPGDYRGMRTGTGPHSPTRRSMAIGTTLPSNGFDLPVTPYDATFTLLANNSTNSADDQLTAPGLEQDQGGGILDDDDDDDAFDEEFGDELEEEFGEPIESEISDPFSGYNRFMTGFNDGAYEYFFSPVARGYRWAVPEFGRQGIANFFHNLLFPLRFINNGLQAKFLNAGEELLRFTINTTIGILGLWDPAEIWFGLEAHEEDFGQTLGYWGVGAGPHIVLPFLGPSNLRDALSLVPDWYLDPVRFVEPDNLEFGVRVFREVNETSLHIGEYESLKKDAIDLYPFLRDVYEQNRRQQILE